MKNHYIIAKKPTAEGFKLIFGKVTGITNNIVEGYYEKDSHIKKDMFEVPVKNVVLDLGTSPHPGTAYGFEVTNRLVTTKVHDYFGEISWFYKPEKEIYKKLMSAFDHAASILKKAGFKDGINGVWEVCPKEAKGKWAGWYKHSNKKNYPNRFSIKPESMPSSEFVYVILHEVAHHLHASFMRSTKLNAAWIKLFNTSIKLNTIKKETSTKLLENLIQGENPPSEFKTDLDEEETNQFNWILRTIKQDHSVSVKELDILFHAEDKEEIANLWPSRTIHKKDLSPVVTEYATTNYRELIAESIAFHLTKRKLPASITKLTEKSLQYARDHQDQEGSDDESDNED